MTPKKHKIINTTETVIRIILGVIFILSSIPKIKQPYDFLASVYNFELVGAEIGALTAIALPWLELFAGACLIGGIFLYGAYLVIVLLGVLFMSVISISLINGLSISCGCFGATSSDIINYATLIRASLIFVFSLTGFCIIFLNRQTTNHC